MRLQAVDAHPRLTHLAGYFHLKLTRPNSISIDFLSSGLRVEYKTAAEIRQARGQFWMKTLGQFYVELNTLGFSQESFADHIDMHRTYYSAIERGEKNLQLDTLERLSAGLGKSLWEIFKDAEPGK